MVILKCLKAVTSPVIRLALRDDDDITERMRKELFLGILVVMIAAYVLLFIPALTLNTGTSFGNWSSFAVILFSIAVVANVIITKSLSAAKASFIIIVSVVYQFFLDIVTYGEGDLYTAGILGMDLMLLSQCSPAHTNFLRNLSVVYIIIATTEQAADIGIYDLVPSGWSIYERPRSQGAGMLPYVVSLRLVVFLLDFFFTRHFATAMQTERHRAAHSIEVAQQLALSLARFDLDGASEQLAVNEGVLHNELHEVYSQLVTNLRSYQPYLPQSCLPAEVESDSSFTYHPNRRNSKPDFTSSLSLSSASVAPEVHSRSVQGRTMGLMSINVVGFLNVSEEMASTAARLSVYLSIVVDSVRKAGGLTEHFDGDRVIASFNGAKQCFSLASNIVECALQLKAAAEERSLQLSAGMSRGRVVCGPMGFEGMMRYTMLGLLPAWVHVLERYAKWKDLSLVVDSSIAGSVEHFDFRLLDKVQFKKSDHPTRTWEPTGRKQFAEEEWMYQLMAEGRWTAYNAVREALLCGIPPDDDKVDALKHDPCEEAAQLLAITNQGPQGPTLMVVSDIGLTLERARRVSQVSLPPDREQ